MTINDIIQFIAENETKKVSTVKDELISMITELTRKKSGPAKTHLRDENNEVVAIFCYYHKKWEILEEAEYGAKKHSTHGFNTMCKEGVGVWTKQNKLRKQIGNVILDKLESGEIDAGSINEYRAELEAELSTIVERNDGHGYDSIDEVKAELSL